MNVFFGKKKECRTHDPTRYAAQHARRRRKSKNKRSSKHQEVMASKSCEPFQTCYTLSKDAVYPLVLDPLPSSHIYSCTLANDTLVTSHRQGIRLYNTARVKAAASMHTSGTSNPLGALTDLWSLREARTGFNFKDTYLCSGSEPIFLDKEQLLLPHSRYFAVASGNDRSSHSVCVLSAAAHFNLHHTLHQSNKIACLKFAHIALDPMKERQLTPVVVSIDELGSVVLFNVERNSAVPLLAWPESIEGGTASSSAAQSATTEKIEASVLSRLTSLSQRHDARHYQLEDGLATNVTLVGPCVQACPHCNNAFSDNALRKKALAPFTAMSLFISSRGNDVQDDTSLSGSSAELRVTYIRLLWGAQGAVVLRKHRVVDETAPHDVCDSGPVLYATPHRTGKALTVLIARPGLQLEIRRGCTGESVGMLQLQNNPNRSSTEYFLQWTALGCHHLLAAEAKEAVFCYAALTDSMTVLLVTIVASAQEVNVQEEEEEKREEEDRKALESWLNDEASTEKPLTKLPDKSLHTKAPLQLSVLYELLSRQPGSTSSTSVEGPLSFLFYPSLNSLLIFAKEEENFFRLSLPFREVLSTTEGAVGASLSVVPLRASEVEKGGAVRAASATTKPEDSLWDTTKRLTNMWAPSSSNWAGYFTSTRSASSAATTPAAAPPATTQPKGSPSTSISRYELNLARPLINAMFQWSSGEGDRSSATVHEVAAGVGAGDPEPTPPQREPPSGERRVPSPSPRHAGAEQREQDTERGYAVTEETVSLEIFPRHGGRGGGSKKRHQSTGTSHHHRQAQQEAEAYFKSQVEARAQSEGGGVAPREISMVTCGDQLRRLETVDECLSRNAISYAWCDQYNELYFAFMERMEALKETHVTQEARRHIRDALERRLLSRHALDDLRRRKMPLRFTTAVQDLIRSRQQTNNKRGLFDFGSYFASGSRPPHLADLQERDKCVYELADLRIKQEKEIAALPLYETVKVYQNEEASGPRRQRHWRLHDTFPFDDERGNTVDMGFYNVSADRIKKGVWEWAPTTDGERASPEGSPTGKRTILVARELKDWVAGPWMYATRWPSVQEVQNGTFEWQNEESELTVVRCRALTRRRVNLKAKKTKEAMEKKHLEALQNLRAELGL